MLYLVGLGLSPDHLSEEARRILSSVETVYLDTYTNVLREEDILAYERAVGRTFLRAQRKDLEDGMKKLIDEARRKDVAIAVSGDPFTATTHVSIYVEALRNDIPVQYVLGISIHTAAISLSGLQHYRFGSIVTVPYLWKESPSFYERIHRNMRNNLHTLLLFDLHPEPLDMKTALNALLYWEKRRRLRVIELGDLVVGMARIGREDCFRFVGTVEELLDVEWGDPPFSLVVPAELHPFEEETLYTIRRYVNGRCKPEG